MAFMKKASITEAKNNLSALIDGLKGGSPVLIVDRGRPVARLEPVMRSARPDDDGRLGRLVRDGIVRPARAPVPKGSWRPNLLARGHRLRRPSAHRRPPIRPMKFWDASAIVPLLMTEDSTEQLQALAAKDQPCWSGGVRKWNVRPRLLILNATVRWTSWRSPRRSNG
jgi:prevent-host-death family protein